MRMNKSLLIGFMAGSLAYAGDIPAGTNAVNLAQGKPCQVFSTLQANGWSAKALTDGKREGARGWCWLYGLGAGV